ncbi:CVNH domain-containing protein [Mycena venus]|uniref:CVNH domain-containing protein n=1 Tax=Mycena venus TaxID=2733690 RepID=A0A8H6XJ42_9AGAR|nr:CVNH domain-containing protein [Mycena venus]
MQFNLLSALVTVSLALVFGSVDAATVGNSTTTALASPTGARIPPRPDTGAGITCGDWQIVPNTADVTAVCADNVGNLHDTKISLGVCMANDDGALHCRVNGGAGGSCVFSSLFQSGTGVFITADCRTIAGGNVHTSNFQLNDCFSNTNGALTC